MQKARRLACSTASLSSPSNTSVALRGRSRTSSAGGDYVEASKSNMPRDSFKSKFRLRKRNKKGLLSLKNGKKGKKTAKANKSVKPAFGSLQNTVVLTPFHTLKKCFQTKLVDLYFNEKIKRNNYKTKMAEKQNMLFEYDVMEMKPSEQKNAKKEKKGSKGKKGGVKFKEQEPKSKRNRSKSQSYCKCDRTKPTQSKEQKTNSRKNSSSQNQSPQPEKRNLQDSLIPKEYQLGFAVSGFEKSKRRKLDVPQITNLPTGPEYGIVPTFLELNSASCSKLRSETNLSCSNVSSRSKIDSWETISDAPSYRLFEGSIAISTTSFDSCLEQSDRESCNYSEHSGIRSKSSGANSVCNTGLKPLKEMSNDCEADFIFKSRQNESEQYTMNEEVGNSNRQLTDFMDCEPQVQATPACETSQHLRPLRRKSKTQTRKSNRENDVGRTYFLRSQSGSKEPVKIAEAEGHTFLGEYGNDNESESKPLAAVSSGAQEEGGDVERKGNNFEPVEDACEENLATKDKTSCQSLADLSQPISKLSSTNIDNATILSKVSATDNAVKKCLSQKETNLDLIASDEPPCEILHKQKTDTTMDEQDDSILNNSSEIGKLDVGLEVKTGEGTNPIKEFGDQTFVELFPLPETLNHLQESSDADKHVANQPQEKEPSFIFGPRTTPGRFGESCEFSFGLNWDFSDDDNSEHGDHFL